MELLSNKRLLWIIIFVLLILNLTSMAIIWFNDWDKNAPRLRQYRSFEQRDHFLKNKLDLTQSQQAKFDSLLAIHRNEIEIKLDEIRTLREELMSKIRNQDLSGESEEIVRAIGERQSELEILNYNHFKEVMAICNDEQKQIFLETIKRAVGPHHPRGVPGDKNSRREGRR
jgi:hypothetical protein